MQNLESLAGQLQLVLYLARDQGIYRVNRVSIGSNRLRLGSPFLQGKPLEVAPKLTGMLFSLCGIAHSIAAQRACAQAVGHTPSAGAESQQMFQIHAEALFEHLLRLAKDWSVALANTSPPAFKLQALFKLKRELQQATDPASALAGIQHWFTTHLLGLPAERWLNYCAQGDANKLSVFGIVGNLIGVLRMQGWESIGNAPWQALPDLPPDWWDMRLRATDAEIFMACPDVDGLACETSSLSRQWHHPALACWRVRYGSGLMTRLLARVLDMLACWEALNRCGEGAAGYGDISESAGAAHAKQEGAGAMITSAVALLPTARGLLAHRVTQQGGLINTYQMVAPTEWNFHPKGSLYHMLHGLVGRNEAELRAKTQSLVAALDPCVAYHLEMIPDA